jgi:ectoine hydroxylase-related dioxygenase (phytanoyl-CoA dioxygenase family)
MDEKQLDYLFDLQGYLILRGAIAPDDLREMNQWVDDHWAYVEHPTNQHWIGHVETHSYSQDDGANFQNIIEAGPVFERLIDHPAWTPLARRYINPVNGISIHENFLNVRGPGGHLYIHCGGHAPLCYLTFRQHNTGEWMVGQINVIMALTDIGPGDGPTVLVPGSHKSTEVHPRLEVKGKGVVAINDGQAAGTALGMQEMYLKAGDVLFFTDALTHGSAERTNPGHRRVVIYRYSPRFIRTRFNYAWSEGLLKRLTPEQRQIIQPLDPRRPA